MEELFSVIYFFYYMVYALKVSMGWGKDQRREVFISISFVFWISKFHYVAGCFPVSAFSVCGKADVAAAGAIILICSTVKKKTTVLSASV